MIDAEYKERYKRIFKKLVKNDSAHFYDESGMPSYIHRNPLMSWIFWKRLEVALSLAGDLQGKEVLDFGCGNGVIFYYLKNKQCRITGCEDKYFGLAHTVCSELQICADIHDDLNQLGDKQFDIIFALDILEHIDNLETYVHKLKRFSRADTKIIISGPTENIFYKTGRLLSGFKGGYHVRSIYQIEQTFKDLGFLKKNAVNLFPPFTLFRISSWQGGIINDKL